MAVDSHCTVGSYLGQRLVDSGVSHFFTVPGDYILALLDELLKVPNLSMIGCRNEMNAGYAADGYCRESGGIGCAVVTYMVGTMSLINAIAGAYSDDLPLLIVAGSPNSCDEPSRHLVHHTIGEAQLYQSARCYEPIVAKTFSIRHLHDAQEMIDEALRVCAEAKKPVYVEIACNIILNRVNFPSPLSIAYFKPKPRSDSTSLDAAVEQTVQSIQAVSKIVLVAGSKLRAAQATEQFAMLANVLECGVANMPDAKGLFSEEHPQYMGCYWSTISSHHVQEIVESADLIIYCGAMINDYTTVGWTALQPTHKVLYLDKDHVEVSGRRFPGVALRDVLIQLTSVAVRTGLKKPDSLKSFQRYHLPHSPTDAITAAKDQDSNAPLNLRFLLGKLQETVNTGVSSIVVETGDSWFLGEKLRLPDSTQYHVQMQYGSCGWALPASLGVALASLSRVQQPESKDSSTADTLLSTMIHQIAPKRILALIGDGSMQFSIQELSTLIRHNLDVTIILLNNQTYTIEVQIHDGIYNEIPNWKYAELVDAMRDNNQQARGMKATTNMELSQALDYSAHHRGLLLVECCLNKDDCTSSLLEWGSRVAMANMRQKP